MDLSDEKLIDMYYNVKINQEDGKLVCTNYILCLLASELDRRGIEHD